MCVDTGTIIGEGGVDKGGRLVEQVDAETALAGKLKEGKHSP